MERLGTGLVLSLLRFALNDRLYVIARSDNDEAISCTDEIASLRSQ